MSIQEEYTRNIAPVTPNRVPTGWLPMPGDLVKRDVVNLNTLGVVLALVSNDRCLVMWSMDWTPRDQTMHDMVENMKNEIRQEVDREIFDTLTTGAPR